MRIESDRPASDAGWLHPLGTGTAASPRTAPLPTRPTPSIIRLAPERQDAIAQGLQRILSLDSCHRDVLRSRGMADEQITRDGYRSMPHHRLRYTAVKELQDRFPVEDLVRFPGIVERDQGSGRYLTMTGCPGILIPIRDVRQRIAGYQIRRDDPVPERHSKYTWLSSSQAGGAPSGAPCHVARPPWLRDAETVYVVEGPINANIVSDHTGAIVVAIPGVSGTRDVPEVIRALLAEREATEEDA